MNTSHSNYTGKVHRSMRSAFGPYTDNQLEPMPDEFRWTPVRVALCIIYAVALVTLLLALR